MNMSIDTIRRTYQIGIIAAIVLFVAMLIDFFALGGALLVPLAVVFGLLAVFLTVMLFVTPYEQFLEDTDTDDDTQTWADYTGDVHEVVDLEGVGPTYAERLHTAGIFHTQELLFADDAHIQKAVGVPAKTVRNWKSMAQLIKVKGIGPQYAEALTRGGVDGIDGLKECDTNETVEKVNTYLEGLDSSVIGHNISPKRMTKWKRSAGRMQKKPINMDKLKVRNLESKQAKADATTA